MIKKHLPEKRDISNYQDLGWTVARAVILVSLGLAFLVTNPVAEVFFDDLPSTLRENHKSPLERGFRGV